MRLCCIGALCKQEFPSDPPVRRLYPRPTKLAKIKFKFYTILELKHNFLLIASSERNLCSKKILSLGIK